MYASLTDHGELHEGRGVDGVPIIIHGRILDVGLGRMDWHEDSTSKDGDGEHDVYAWKKVKT